MDYIDADMLAALEESARVHSTTVTEPRLSCEFQKERSELPLSQHHWKNTASPGCLWQIDTLNQFSAPFHKLILEYSTSTSLCGYLCIANAILMRKAFNQKAHQTSYTRKQVKDLLVDLWSVESVIPMVEEVVRFIQGRRRLYVENHASEFGSEKEKELYCSAWVANYEISDFCREFSKGAQLEQCEGPLDTRTTVGQASLRSLAFCRYNQYPQRPVSTHEEHVRLAEEACFGGKSGNDEVVTYGENDCVFFIETFGKDDQKTGFHRPEGWEESAGRKSAETVLCVDLNGHFVAAAPLILEEEDGLKKCLLIVNTTGISYLQSAGHVFDLAFPPE
jgi:hypothetical protein